MRPCFSTGTGIYCGPVSRVATAQSPAPSCRTGGVSTTVLCSCPRCVNLQKVNCLFSAADPENPGGGVGGVAVCVWAVAGMGCGVEGGCVIEAIICDQRPTYVL